MLPALEPQTVPSELLGGPHSPQRHNTIAKFRPLVLVGGVLTFSILASDWIAGLSIFVLWMGWKYLSREPGAPVIAAAFTHQWLQVTIAVFYAVLTGRQIAQMQNSDYRPMLLIGLGSLIAMFTGFYLAAGLRRRPRPGSEATQLLPVTLVVIAPVYAASVAVAGGIQAFAWSHPELTQVVFVLSLFRYVLLFVVVNRLAAPSFRWGWILLVLLAEVAIGFAGFFADFRQPIVIVALAVLGAVDRRRARTWVLLGLLAALAIAAGVIWTAIKPVIRRNYDYSQTSAERLRTVAQLTDASLNSPREAWEFHTDTTVTRLWAIYYPALAVARVPSVIPHENGALLMSVIKHIFMPRFLFPDKPAVPSDSDKVRKYSGVWVSGREIRTSYAFGYAAESYVDFGVPLMFLPIFAFGALMGAAYKFLMRSIRSAELRTAAIVVIFWSVLSMFEVSWMMMLGFGLTQVLVLGAIAIVADRILIPKRRAVATASIRTYGQSDVFGTTSSGQPRLIE